MAPSLFSVHAVHWTEQGVEGPANLFGPTLGRKRTFIAWSEIGDLGETPTQDWYLVAQDGRRIYWSCLYKGHAALGRAPTRHRPDFSEK